MSRIAIQFFGHLRTFEKCLPSLKRHLLNHYNCDIFIHTWDAFNHNTKTWHTDFKNTNKPVHESYLIKKLGISKEQIQIEHQEIYTKDKITARGVDFGLQGLYSVYHSIKSVNKLREKYEKKHKIKYDLVLFIRPDILLMKNLNLDKYINDTLNIDNKNVYFSGHAVNRDMYGMNYFETVDLLFFGKPDTMTKLCNKLKVIPKKGDIVDYYLEGFLIDNIYMADLNPVYLGTYQYGDALKIKRYTQIQINRSNIIGLHIRKKGIFLHLLRILPPVINLNINIFNLFCIIFSIGKFDNFREK